MIYTAEEAHGFRIEVTDNLLTDGCAAVHVLRLTDGPGNGIEWSEKIRIGSEPGLPVWHTRHDGRTVAFGGPSHSALSQARSRADFLLAGRIEQARSALIALATAQAQQARAARRAATSPTH